MPDYIANTPADVALAGATPKTILSLITSANRRARIKEVFVGFKSVTSSDTPALVELVQFDTDGTGTAVTPRALDPADGAADVTSKHTYTVEPTTNEVVRKHWLVPPSGSFVIQNPLGEEDVVPVSKTLALRVTAAQAQNARSYIKYAE